MEQDWPTLRILTVIPANPGWTVYVLFRGMRPTDPPFASDYTVAAWGHIERQVRERGVTCGSHTGWEPLIFHDAEDFTLRPADDIRVAQNWVLHEIRQPGEPPPPWFGSHAEADDARARALEKQQKDEP